MLELLGRVRWWRWRREGPRGKGRQRLAPSEELQRDVVAAKALEVICGEARRELGLEDHRIGGAEAEDNHGADVAQDRIPNRFGKLSQVLMGENERQGSSVNINLQVVCMWPPPARQQYYPSWC